MLLICLPNEQIKIQYTYAELPIILHPCFNSKLLFTIPNQASIAFIVLINHWHKVNPIKCLAYKDDQLSDPSKLQTTLNMIYLYRALHVSQLMQMTYP